MEDGTKPAADNTAQSVDAQPLLHPEAAPAAAPAGGEPKPAPAATAPGEAKPQNTPDPDEGKKDGDDAPLLDPDKDGEEKPPEGAPETYQDFTMPEGFTLEGELKDEVTAMFRGMNLSQDNAQKLVDYFTKRVTDEKAAGLSELAARRKAWRAEVRQRPEYATERALALKGMRKVITDPDEKELFQDSWMSDHPALWKVFVKIGRLVGEDTPPPAGRAAGTEDDSILRRFSVKE